MESIEISFRKEIAEKWRNASPAKKAQVEQRIEMELGKEQKRSSKEEFIKFLDQLGKTMEERGLTEEILMDILDDEV